MALLTKVLARWPSQTWSEIAKAVLLPTSDSMDESDSSIVAFTCGEAFGECTDAPRVTLSTQNRQRLLKSLQILRRELYQDNPFALQSCGDACFADNYRHSTQDELGLLVDDINGCIPHDEPSLEGKRRILRSKVESKEKMLRR